MSDLDIAARLEGMAAEIGRLSGELAGERSGAAAKPDTFELLAPFVIAKGSYRLRINMNRDLGFVALGDDGGCHAMMLDADELDRAGDRLKAIAAEIRATAPSERKQA